MLPYIKHENKFPDCLCIELQATTVQSNQIDLPVIMHFNEQWELLLAGRVKFGLKGGELKLMLKNGYISNDSHNLTQLIELSINNGLEETENFQLRPVCQVSTNGSMSNPAWMFELKIGSQVLKGSLQMAKLGTLQVVKKPCDIEATFEISLRNLYLTNVEGLYPVNISRNKQIIIERAIAKHLLESKLKPYLSRVELRYG